MNAIGWLVVTLSLRATYSPEWTSADVMGFTLPWTTYSTHGDPKKVPVTIGADHVTPHRRTAESKPLRPSESNTSTSIIPSDKTPTSESGLNFSIFAIGPLLLLNAICTPQHT